jgi:hypothetical protein
VGRDWARRLAVEILEVAGTAGAEPGFVVIIGAVGRAIAIPADVVGTPLEDCMLMAGLWLLSCCDPATREAMTG